MRLIRVVQARSRQSERYAFYHKNLAVSNPDRQNRLLCMLLLRHSLVSHFCQGILRRKQGFATFNFLETRGLKYPLAFMLFFKAGDFTKNAEQLTP